MNNETIPVTTPSLHDSITPLSVAPEESDHRGNGKIARLPKILRDQVNRMLDDGVPYKAIIEKLEQSTDPPLPYKLLEINISRWKDNGYQKYLRHQEWRDQLRIVRENGSEMSELTDGPKFQETLIQIALTEIFRVLQQGELKPDSLNYIRLFNALARLNREALSLRKYNDHLAKEEVALKQLDPNRKLTDNEHRAIADIIDQVMEMPRPRPLWSAPAERSGDGALVDSPPQGESSTSLGRSGPDLEEAQTSSSSSLSASGGEGQPALRSAFDEGGGEVAPSRIEKQKGRTSLVNKTKNPSTSAPPSRPCRRRRKETQTKDQPSEHCLDCHHPLPPLTPEGKRPNERCEHCNILLPPPGTCTRPSSDKCHHCGTTLPRRLPSGRRPKYACHNCGAGLGRELDEDIKKYAEE